MEFLRISDLHDAYQGISYEEAKAMADLGAVCWLAARGPIQEAVNAAASADESIRADTWRAEGRRAAIESFKVRLAEAEKADLRAIAAEASAAHLRDSMETIISERVTMELEKIRMSMELQRIAPLQQQLSAMSGKEDLITLLRQSNALLQERYDKLEKELVDARAIVDELKDQKTKSSHVIGKQGEATVWEMLETTILPEFQYAEVKNMAGVSHAADFHLWLMRPTGKRMKVLIDSKKYKRAVNSEEINKLIADVDGDPEAHCGIMVSLTSPICTTKQFQIKLTEKQKPILYLTFCDLAVDYHAKLLSWGIRALMSAVHDTNEEVTMEVHRIEELLEEIITSVKDIDGMIKTHTKMIDSLRGMKVTVMQKIMDFRGGSGGGSGGVKSTDDTDVIQTVEAGCVSVNKALGIRCGKPVVAGMTKCKHHMPRKPVAVGVSGE